MLKSSLIWFSSAEGKSSMLQTFLRRHLRFPKTGLVSKGWGKVGVEYLVLFPSLCHQVARPTEQQDHIFSHLPSVALVKKVKFPVPSYLIEWYSLLILWKSSRHSVVILDWKYYQHAPQVCVVTHTHISSPLSLFFTSFLSCCPSSYVSQCSALEPFCFDGRAHMIKKADLCRVLVISFTPVLRNKTEKNN